MAKKVRPAWYTRQLWLDKGVQKESQDTPFDPRVQNFPELFTSVKPLGFFI